MNYPPGSPPPPPMQPPPPMGPPPGGGPPAPGYYPPPPPPQKSSAMKWVLIGCGIVGALGLICCGAFGGLSYFMYAKVKEEMVSQFKPILNNNEAVKNELGEVQSLDTTISEWRSEKVDGKD